MHAETREKWREWLLAHHATETSAWLVSWKKATDRPAVSYDDAVSEALAVGRVDSVPRKLDDERTMLYFSRRKPSSAWSRPNKKRVEQLRAEGLMTEAGEDVIAEAQRRGTWSMLDDVENLVVPDDLAEALDAHPHARENWDGFPPSARRASWNGSCRPSGRPLALNGCRKPPPRRGQCPRQPVAQTLIALARARGPQRCD